MFLIMFGCYVLSLVLILIFYFFFFNDTATTEIYTLSLHDALPISCLEVHFIPALHCPKAGQAGAHAQTPPLPPLILGDRKSTRLNSSHGYISYAVFCLKKKKKKKLNHSTRTTRADPEHRCNRHDLP